MEKLIKESKLRQILKGVAITALALGVTGCFGGYSRHSRRPSTHYPSSYHSGYRYPHTYRPHSRIHGSRRIYGSGFGFRGYSGFGGYHSPGLLGPKTPHRRHTSPRIVPPRTIRSSTQKNNYLNHLNSSRSRANKTLRRKINQSRNSSRSRSSRPRPRSSRQRIQR